MGTLFNEDEVAKIESETNTWQKYLEEKLATAPQSRESFTTVSGSQIRELYTPTDIKDFDYGTKLGFPGQYPYTRGVQASMYRGRLWTMRMFAGLGSAEETNERFHYLVSQGQTGLSTAFDMPTLMGYDTGDPKALG
jgi:methylmalonyl-CoA mutase N-terminal domain/subunit